MTAPLIQPVRLTSLSHGGGCDCKIAPGLLEQIIARTASSFVPRDLLVGIETSDDAAVYRINDTQAIVATADFVTPIVDDPYDFGAIAATNALSDVYAMGGTPLFALALVGMPMDVLPLETVRRILEGGESLCRRAGIPVAGGHSIDSVEPIYGLVAIGLVNPRQVKRNSASREGDAIILGKPLGVGVYSAALKQDALSPQGYRAMLASTTQLNTPGTALGALDDVHAMTDVTGFGLLGHLLEVCKGSRLGAEILWEDVPLLPDVLGLVERGLRTGASARNWSAYGARVDLGLHGDTPRDLLTDPQTSGGLLVTCRRGSEDRILAEFKRAGFDHAAVIGRMRAGEPHIAVR